MTKEQEFRKQAEEAKFKAFSFMCKKVAELEKENAELKEHHKSVCETLTNTHRSLREQLTKAKEILEELAKMEYVINPPVDKVRSLMVKAEQFLKEIEK